MARRNRAWRRFRRCCGRVCAGSGLNFLMRMPLRRTGASAFYAEALAGRMATQEVWSQEQIHHQLGVTRGSLRSKGPERTSRFSR